MTESGRESGRERGKRMYGTYGTVLGEASMVFEFKSEGYEALCSRMHINYCLILSSVPPVLGHQLKLGLSVWHWQPEIIISSSVAAAGLATNHDTVKQGLEQE